MYGGLQRYGSISVGYCYCIISFFNVKQFLIEEYNLYLIRMSTRTQFFSIVIHEIITFTCRFWQQ